MLMLFLRELLFLYPCQTFQFQLETFNGGENIMKLKIKSYIPLSPLQSSLMQNKFYKVSEMIVG